MTKCVVFDLDDTLYVAKRAYAAALEAVRSSVRQMWGDDGLAEWDAAHKRAFDWQFANHSDTASCHNRGIRFQRALEEMRKPLGAAVALEETYFNSFLAAISPMPGAERLMARLRDGGVRVGLGSNMTAYWQYRKLVQLGLVGNFDFIVTSEEAGAEKPAPAFFGLVLEKAGVAPAECAFIGDNLEFDALASARAGMRGVWLQPDAAARASRPDVESIASLLDFEP